MKKILMGMTVMVSSLFSVDSPISYDLTLYNYFVSSFWQHNYYTVSNDLKTHSGRDYQVGDNWKHVEIYSYGFGKIVGKTPTYGAISIRNLIDNGKYVKVNLLHMQNSSILISDNEYISKNQFLGKEGNTGLGYSNQNEQTHLHFEVAGQVSLAWISTARACPGSGCPDENLQRTTDYDLGDLKAHYVINSTKERNIPFGDRVWYDPAVFITHDELLPFVSRTNQTPSQNNFDVYGESNETIYGYLNIDGVGLDRVGVLARSSQNRIDAENSTASYTKEKYLAYSETDFDGLYGNSDKYEKGDYLFVPYVYDNSEPRFGYPIKFAFVDKGGFIIDNDKPEDGTARYNEHLTHSELNTVPGYFLTSRLAKTSATNFRDYVRWSVPTDTKGRYKISAHIAEATTAEDKNVTYTIHTKDGNKTKSIKQILFSGTWAELGEYELDDESYVDLSLYNTEKGEWISFDAMKFERTKIVYSDIEDLDEEYQKAIDYLSNTIKLFQGIGNSEFGVDRNITRAEFAKVIVLMLDHIGTTLIKDERSNSELETQYPDINDVSWFLDSEKEYAKVVLGMGIMKGSSKTTLKPASYITYRELSKMIGKAFFYGKTLKKPWNSYTRYSWHYTYYRCFDNNDNGYSYIDDEEVNYNITSIFETKKDGITKIPGEVFAERGLYAKREEVALFLYRAYMLWKNKVSTEVCAEDTKGWGE